MTNGTSPTPESNARDVAGLTSAVNILVSQFIRPAAQQANANRETIARVTELLERHAEGMLSLEARLDQLTTNLEQLTTRLGRLEDIVSSIATQQQTNAQQIAQNAAAITRFDTKLEETRQLVAKNASDIAKLTVKQDRNTEAIGELRECQKRNAVQIERNAVQIERNAVQIERNAVQVEALAEASRSQLAGIISNGRRIERLEQRAG